MPRNLSKEEMDELWIFHEDGTISWRNPDRTRPEGKAGCITSAGYLVVTLGKMQYFVHRLVFAYHKGYWPRLIDHRDTNKSNNRIDNLRDASAAVNSHNVSKTRGKSRFRGVSFLRKRIRAMIQVDGRRKFLGYFDTEEAASAAYEIEKAKILEN